MNQPERIKVSISNSSGNTMNLDFSWDANLEDMEHCFKMMLYWMTYTPEQVKEMFEEEG